MSLLEMLDFAAADFVSISTTLVQLTAYEGKVIALVPGSNERLVSTLNALNGHASHLNMDFTMNQVREIYQYLGTDKPKASRLSEMLRQLSKRVHEELSARQFFYVPLDIVMFYDGTWLTEEAFACDGLVPVLNEFYRAGRCLAVGENTACVFHLMRIVEWAGKQVAQSLEPPPSKTSITDIITAITSRMEQKYQTKTDEWKRAEPFYAQMLSDMLAFSRGYRNDTAHNLGRTYDEAEARHLIGVVERFAIHVVQHLNLIG